MLLAFVAVVAEVAVEAFPVKAPTKVVDVTEVSPAIVVAVPPRDMEVLPIVTALFVNPRIPFVLLKPVPAMYAPIRVWSTYLLAAPSLTKYFKVEVMVVEVTGNVADTPLNPDPSPKKEPEKEPESLELAPVDTILLDPKEGLVITGLVKVLLVNV